MKRAWMSCLLFVALGLPRSSRSEDGPPRPGEKQVPPNPRTTAEPAPARDPKSMGIRFSGRLPGSVDPRLEGKFRVEFRIYRSPQGGDPIWREEREVDVTGGRMDIVLGEKSPIPMEVHETTFKFLGASVEGNREVYPRHPIVNVVYASTREALLGAAEERAKGAARKTSRAPESGADGREKRTVSSATEKPVTWREALIAARRAGGDLPDYEEWYRALESSSADEIRERTGHYEWVLPWVYDTSSHGRLNTYFRGRFQGCDYMDLSPEKQYPYRVAHPREKGAGKEGGPKQASGGPPGE